MSANYLCCQCNTSGGWESVCETSLVATLASGEHVSASSATSFRDDFSVASYRERLCMTTVTACTAPNDTRVAERGHGRAMNLCMTRTKESDEAGEELITIKKNYKQNTGYDSYFFLPILMRKCLMNESQRSE